MNAQVKIDPSESVNAALEKLLDVVAKAGIIPAHGDCHALYFGREKAPQLQAAFDNARAALGLPAQTIGEHSA